MPLCLGLAGAQITRLDDPEAFSGPHLTFGELLEGTRITNHESKQGVRFLSRNGGEVVVEVLTVLPILPPKFDTVLRNRLPGSSSANSGLIVSFSNPVRRMGFTLGNGPATATIKAFTAEGIQLGETEQSVVEELVGPFVGLETSHPAGISTVVLDYGESPAEEQVNDLRFDYLNEGLFRVVIPQVAAGQAQDRTLATLIHLQSLVAEATPVTVRFLDPSGSPLPVNIDGREGAVWEDVLGYRAHRVLALEAPLNDLLIGYGVVEARGPVAVQAVYRTLAASGLPVEAAIAGGPEGINQVASVEIDPALGLDTGIALVNTSQEKARVHFRLIDELSKGKIIDNGVKIELAGGQHRAVFLSEIYGKNLEDLGYEDFFGSLDIRSDQPIAATVLRTYQGFAVSSLVVESVWNPGQPE